jgi:hypothetical protein
MSHVFLRISDKQGLRSTTGTDVLAFCFFDCNASHVPRNLKRERRIWESAMIALIEWVRPLVIPLVNVMEIS